MKKKKKRKLRRREKKPSRMVNQLRYSKRYEGGGGEIFRIIAAKVTRKHGKYYDRRRGLYTARRAVPQSRGLSFVNNGPIRK